jgi:hypothetical protein
MYYNNKEEYMKLSDIELRLNGCTNDINEFNDFYSQGI